MIYQEITQYSPILDRDITRLSTSDERGAEYFCLVDQKDGRSWRESRDKALDQIEQAIMRGDPPGEINITLDA